MNKYNTVLFENALKELEIELSSEQMNQFLLFYEILIEWNQVMNLTAITDFDEVIIKHFIDSLALVKLYKPCNNTTLIDVGTGAGFPGIPLKIAFPYFNITLLDSLKKRVDFLNHVIKELKLDHIKALHGRAEDYARDEKYRQSFSICVSRAVANLSTLSEYCLPFVEEGGMFISYKSDKAEEEISSAKSAVKILGGKFETKVKISLPGSNVLSEENISRILVPVRKIKNTPGKYPRKAGLPSRAPLS